MARSCSICTARVPVVALAILHVRVHLLPETYEFSRDLAQVPDKQGDHAVLLASGEPFEVFTQLKVSHNTKFKLRAHKDCPLREVAHPMFARVACEDYAETFLSCFTNLGNVHIFLVPGCRVGDSPGVGGARGCSGGREVLSISAGRGQGVERRAGPVVGRDSC